MSDYFIGFDRSVRNDAYEHLGSFLSDDRAVFRVWAPCAEAVSVVGDFNGWDREQNKMELVADGVWETEISGLKEYDVYKYAIRAPGGKVTLKSDPYARHFETSPANASKLYASHDFGWTDGEWRENTANGNIYESPVNIYEVHLGSWKNYGDEVFLDYVTFAKQIIRR